jgi:hypothetical protein
MSIDPTLPQGGSERRRSQEKSLHRAHPPTQVPGYIPERFLGGGAFGEVWVAVEKNTGRRVAIKFYAHRGGLDWSLLSREVEKLAFLFADRYVVQLIGVGWDADPPYYIMEYLERGSLADRLQAGPLSAAEAVDLFREIAIGLVHAHGKGVLHCDLKPGNILLDHDNKPRLADFGQSRLSHEQIPALGTLFYMAPEQANLTAVPDARWDVYALGALLYCMLTGSPPYRGEPNVRQIEETPELNERLSLYRRMIRRAPRPSAHRKVRGVDRALAEIVDRCLAVNANHRYPNVQAVLDALDARAARRARRPTILMGAVGPALVLAVASLFAWEGFNKVVHDSNEALIEQALKSNQFAADNVALVVADGVGRRYRAVEQLSRSAALKQEFLRTVSDPEVSALLDRLDQPGLEEGERARLLEEFRRNPQRKRLQAALEAAIPAEMAAGQHVNSWFLNDARGIQIARVPEQGDTNTIGLNYAWRSYFSGRARDEDKSWRPAPGEHLERTSLSAAYQSEATAQWNVAVTTPVLERKTGRFLGVGGLTVAVGKLVGFPGSQSQRQFAVLVENPLSNPAGRILQHPAFEATEDSGHLPPERFTRARITVNHLPDTKARKTDYRDPLATKGDLYDQRWLAEMSPVWVDGNDTGWLVIVQESYDSAIGGTLGALKRGLIRIAAAALGVVALVVLALWSAALYLLNRAGRARLAPAGDVGGTERTPSEGNPTGSGAAGAATPKAGTESTRWDSATEQWQSEK